MNKRIIIKAWVVGMTVLGSFLTANGQTTSGVKIHSKTFTLQQVLDSAKANNIGIRNARRDIGVAVEQKKEAFTNFFPNVSATGMWFNANRPMATMDLDLAGSIPPALGTALAQALPPEALVELGSPMSMEMMKNGTIASVSAIQPVFAGGQIVNGNRLAKVGENAARLKVMMSEDEVERTTENYFWQIVTLEEKMQTVLAVEKWLADIGKDVDVAVRAGVAMRNDLLQVQLRQNEVESQKLKLKNGIEILKLLLAQQCGLKDTAFVLSYDATEVISPLALKTDHQAALANTPEYRLLNIQVEAAKLKKKMAVGENMPSIAVGAGYNYHNLLGNDQKFAMVFATVSVPISAWWGGSHAIKRRQIEEMKAVDMLDENSQLLKIKMQKGWNDVVEAYQQLDIAQRSIEQATENLRLNQDFYKAGTSSMSDLLEAQTLYQQALDKRTDAYAEYQNKILEYKQATHTGTTASR